MNLLVDVPDLFSGMFTTFWVFAVVVGVISLIFVVLFIVLMIFIIRKASQSRTTSMSAVASVEIVNPLEIEKACDFCGNVMPSDATECPNCAAPVKAK